MKFSIVLRYRGDFAAQLNILVCNAAHLIKRLDIPAIDIRYCWNFYSYQILIHNLSAWNSSVCFIQIV